MQILETADGDLYDQNADVVERGKDKWEAYIRVGTTKTGTAIIIRQGGTNDLVAVKGLLSKTKAFMTLMESAANDRFQEVVLAAMDNQIAELKRQMGVTEFDLSSKDDDKDEPS